MNPQDVQIRKVTADELLQLQLISRETFAETFAKDNEVSNLAAFLNIQYDIRRLQAELMNYESSFFFAEVDGLIMGYTKINEGMAQTEQHGPGYIELERIYVSKQSQGMGVGKKLLSHAIQEARRQEYPYLWLGVWEKNFSAIGFYIKQGFEVFGEHDFKLGNEVQRDLVMRLAL